MKLGIHMGLTHELHPGTLAQRVEALGFDFLLVGEHAIVPANLRSASAKSDDGTIPEAYGRISHPFVALAFAAAATSRIQLGTGVCVLPVHNPLLLAKEIATLDHLSEGRFVLGIGAGSLEEEIRIAGGDFAHRWAQTRECALAMKACWENEESSFSGRYYRFPPVRCFPKPHQRGGPPILLGARPGRGLARIVEWADGWMPLVPHVSLEEVRRGREELDVLAKRAGRDPRTIQVLAQGRPGVFRTRDELKEVEAAGVDAVGIVLTQAQPEKALAELDEIAGALLN